MSNGWVAIHRKFTNWEWYDDHNTTRLFIHMILRSNHKDEKWRGVSIKRGSFLSGRVQLSRETGLSERQIRTSLNRLKSTNEVTIQTTNKYSIYSMVKWEEYQGKRPADCHSSDQQSTTNNNDNNINNKHFMVFWDLFPRQRRGDKAKAKKAYDIALKKDTEENILSGLRSYIQSEEVAKGYAKGCTAWLNDSRWTNEYEPHKKAMDDYERAKAGKFICG